MLERRPHIFTHQHPKRCFHVKLSVTLLIVLAIMTGHWVFALSGNLLWIWVDPE